MIEAEDHNDNGGIFSLPVGFSLLAPPPAGIKPTVLKKFGNWNESEENIAKYPIHLVSNKDTFLAAWSKVSKFLHTSLWIFVLLLTLKRPRSHPKVVS